MLPHDFPPWKTVSYYFYTWRDAGVWEAVRGLLRIDLVPGSRRANSFNLPDPHLAAMEDQLRLREFLDAEVRGRYDLVLLDCPPNLCMCSWGALAASDFIIVPLQPEDYGAQGIIDIQESMALAQQRINAGLRLLGFLITMYEGRKTLHQMYDQRLRSMYGAAVLETRVPRAAEFPEAIAHRKTVSQYQPRGAAAGGVRAAPPRGGGGGGAPRRRVVPCGGVLLS